MNSKDILAAVREYERQSTRARQRFEKTGDSAFLTKVSEAEAALDRLALMEPDDK